VFFQDEGEAVVPRGGSVDLRGGSVDLRGGSVDLRGGSVDLSIVIPAFNERQRLMGTLDDLHSTLDSIDRLSLEIIVVDDGSTDGTAELAKKALSRLSYPGTVIRHPSNKGKGEAVRTGVRAASGEKIMFVDADGATNPASIPQMVKLLDDYDFVIGSRALSSSQVTCMDPKRPVMGRVFNKLVSQITQIDYLDTQCGFKGFTAEAAKLLFHFAKSSGYAFDVELLYIAKKLGIKVVELPIEWEHKQGSHIRFWRDPLVMTKEVIQTRYQADRSSFILTAVLNARDRKKGRGNNTVMPGKMHSEWARILKNILSKGYTILACTSSVILLLPFTPLTAIPSLEAEIKEQLGTCDITWIPMSLAQLTYSKIMRTRQECTPSKRDMITSLIPATTIASSNYVPIDLCLASLPHHDVQTAC